MKKLTLISSAIAVVLLFTLSSCGVSNKSVAQLDDMYYSPSAAKHQARIDDRNRKRELAEREANGEFEQTPGTSFQSNSNNNEGANQNSASYEDEYRMNYGSYFTRFGNGYHHNPYMRPNRMMYNPGFSFWSGYNNFGMGYGMGYGNPMMMGGYYDPYCPWGGGMGMGMMGYNPYMNPYMGMGGFGMNPYNSGFMNGYMYGSMAGGNGFSSGGSSSNQRPQAVIARRQSYGSNQSVVNRNRNSAAYGTTNTPNSNNTVQSRGTSTGTSTRGSSTPADRRTSTTPARTNVRGGSSTPSRSTAPAPTRTPSRSYNQPAPRTPSSPSYSTPSSRGGSGGGRSTGGSSGGSSGGGSRGGRR